MSKVKLEKISTQSFEHESDRAALEALRKTVGFDRLMRALARMLMDRSVGVLAKSSYVRCGPKQCPQLWKLFTEVCDTLDMEPPPLYLGYFGGAMNAFTAGVEKPAIVVSSELVNALTDEELQGVLGHELGHHMAGHVLYRFVALNLKWILLEIGGTIPGLRPILEFSVMSALYYWFRCSELTADRAGLLAVQNPETILRLESKLAAGTPTRFSKELDLEVFMEQARECTLDEDQWTKFIREALEAPLTHPWPLVRAREIEKWVRSGAYGRILAGEYMTRAAATVACGRHPNEGEDGAAGAAAAGETVVGAILARTYGVHVAPRIPEDVLHVALGSWVGAVEDHERVVAFYDDTLSGAGDRGVLLTSSRVFSSARPKQGIHYGAIEVLEDIPSGLLGLLSPARLRVNDLELRFHTREIRDAFRRAIEGAREAHRGR